MYRAGRNIRCIFKTDWLALDYAWIYLLYHNFRKNDALILVLSFYEINTIKYQHHNEFLVANLINLLH